VAWTFPGEETDGIEASFVTDGDTTRLKVESIDSDGTPRNFYDTRVTLVRPDLTSREVSLSQVAPGVYEVPLGTLDPGAYALRVIQTKPGDTPLGRTLGLVAQTPAEYRMLGTNEPLLSALRTATGGRALVTPQEAWRHDLKATSAATDLWPLLLLLALLLWPLDIAVRRVSVTRRELAAARASVGARWQGWRGPARRTEAVGGMFAAKERAAGTRTRAALVGPAPAAGTAAPPGSATSAPSGPPAAAPVPTAAATPAKPAEPAPVAEVDTLARLRDAKRRARR
jgi:hypothetical protein